MTSRQHHRTLGLPKLNTPPALKHGREHLSYLGDMSSDFLGGGLVFAIAATLWIVYLIPTWLRRRTFDATERNAVRLQQTIRALAETTELPSEMRLEASARAVAEQKRVLRQAENHARLRMRAATAAAIGFDDAGSRARARRRGQRLVASVGLLASLVGITVGITFIFTQQGWQVLAVSCVVFAVAIVVQNELSGTVAGAVPRDVAVTTTGQAFADYAPERSAPESRAWTPTSLPKPMHLSQGSIAAAVVQSQIAAERLRLSSAESALVERVRNRGETHPPIRMSESPARVDIDSGPARIPAALAPRIPAAAAPSKFAHMGFVSEAETGLIDLDAALLRRRTAS
jgi:hypothetical protein